MSRRRFSLADRQAVQRRAGSCCEYCGIQNEDSNVPHEVDHIIAEQHGGETVSENLAFACFHCNHLKGPNIASFDPTTGQIVRLFHPRRDRWEEHFRLAGARIVALSAIGRATVELLRLNAEERLAPRQALLAAGRYRRP
ncbi:MAG: HNH endonuclease [Verrucomicrobiales bacterium]|nr:HNH endonuclease [Verrucomicrobiales bacterium]